MRIFSFAELVNITKIVEKILKDDLTPKITKFLKNNTEFQEILLIRSRFSEGITTAKDSLVPRPFLVFPDKSLDLDRKYYFVEYAMHYTSEALRKDQLSYINYHILTFYAEDYDDRSLGVKISLWWDIMHLTNLDSIPIALISKISKNADKETDHKFINLVNIVNTALVKLKKHRSVIKLLNK